MIKTGPLSTLSGVDQAILYTDYALHNLRSLSLKLARSDPEFVLPRLDVLPHGVDVDTFFPLGGSTAAQFEGRRAGIRAQLFPNHPELREAFIVLNGNAPYPRKRIDLTIKGFAKFARHKHDAFLYLHALHLNDSTRGGLRRLAQDAGVARQLLLNVINPDGRPVSEIQLNRLYNACDVGINTAVGEGWGLSSFEHAATGAAQLLPEHTSFIENWNGAAMFVETEGKEEICDHHTEGYPVTVEAISDIFERLYRDPGYLQKMSQIAYAHATSPRFQWAGITKRLTRIFREILSA